MSADLMGLDTDDRSPPSAHIAKKSDANNILNLIFGGTSQNKNVPNLSKTDVTN